MTVETLAILLAGFIIGLMVNHISSSSSTTRRSACHEHDFEPIPWDDATMGYPFWCFPEDDDPVEHYAKKCSRCGEVRYDWVGPPGDRVPEVPVYRGWWTKDRFKAWAREKVRADFAERRRRE